MHFGERNDARGFLEKRRYSTLSKATNTSVYYTNNLRLQDSDILEIKSGKMILQTCDFRDLFLQHRLPKTKEKNYSDLQNLDCSKKGLRKFINNKSYILNRQQRKMLKFWWIDNRNFANIVSEIRNERVR